MFQIIKMAYRDLGRNRRRSFFSALALALGLALLLFVACAIGGYMRGATDRGIRLQSGHLQVRSKTYNEDKTSLKFEDLVADPEQLAAQIAALPPVQAATPRLYVSGIVETGDQSVGVRIVGIDPASSANDPYRNGMVSGAFLTADDRAGLLMGQPLSNKLGLKVGDKINLLANTSNGDVSQQSFLIRGIYTTQTPAFDQATLFFPLAKAQAIAPAVFERTREIGILSAIGMRANHIMALFFAESSLLAVGGIVMGLALGALLVAYATQYGFFIGNIASSYTGMLLGERIYGYLTVNDAVTLTLLAFVVPLLAALYPARIAARMEPVEAQHGAK